MASPTTTISSSYGGAIPFIVDAVHIDALGLNTPYIARHGTFDPDGPQDSKTDMRWVIEQRPDIVEGYLSGLALLRGAGPDEIIGARRRKMILEMVSSPRFQREYSSSATRRTIVWTGPSFCAATSGRPIHGATRSTACRSPRPRSRRSRAGELHRLGSLSAVQARNVRVSATALHRRTGRRLQRSLPGLGLGRHERSLQRLGFRRLHDPVRAHANANLQLRARFGDVSLIEADVIPTALDWQAAHVLWRPL